MTIAWQTTKTSTGYTATVSAVGYRVEAEVLKTSRFQTRAQAVAFAKKWALYFRRVTRNA